jgi:hypothetical protein
MYNLGPEARKRQQMMLQKNKSPNQRQTRQFDSTKHTRSTFNSRNEKLLYQEITMKKKQKLQHETSITNTANSSSHNNSDSNNLEPITSNVDSASELNMKNNKAGNNNNLASSDDEYVYDGNKDISANQKYFSSQNILGDGHTQILHAYVRETLFKNIKILSPSHLETKGDIMQEILRLLKYSELKNGNLTAFSTACRMEIRKTMCSRRGYVKRQTGIIVAGRVQFSLYFS